MRDPSRADGLPPLPGVRESILVVEDEPAHAEAVARALEPLGDRYRVRVAGSLAEGRLAIAAELPMLVLCDLNLPDGKAFDLLLGSQRPAFPLLVLTSHGDERMAVHSIRSGALDYVVKSREAFSELPRTVTRALREWQLIDERSRAEQALRESEERFRVLFASAPDACLIHDLGGRVLDANLAADRLLSLHRGELLGRYWRELGLSDDQASAPLARLERQSRGQSTGPELLHWTAANGQRLELELRTVPLQLRGELAILATLQDVSSRNDTERARRRLEEQLHHALKMDAIGRLAGGIAHDFNNLLTAIGGYAGLLLAQEEPGGTRYTGLTEILNAAQRASGLTSQLLAFSRKQVIAPVVVDLNRQLSHSMRLIARLIGEHISLTFERDAAPCCAKIDPNQFEQVLINLAVNARDAMPSGGKLVVRTRLTEVRPGAAPHIDARPGMYAIVSVEDSGSGMSEETLNHLFEPFFTTKELGRGTGLGLSIIYGIVKQNGGFIVVDSRIGCGSRFDIYLPRTEEQPHATPSPALRPQDGPTGDEAILLVEDEPAVRDVAAQFLRACGYDVVVAHRGDDALDLVRRFQLPVDLLVTDVILPMMNGRQLYEQMRELRPELRVLFMSGYNDDVIAPHGVLEPDVAFVEKPFSQETLAHKVREALGRARKPPRAAAGVE